MKGLLVTLALLLAAGCSTAPAGPSEVSRNTAPPTPAAPATTPTAPATPQPPPDPDPRPDFTIRWTFSGLTRDQIRDGLERLMNTGEGQPSDKLTTMFSHGTGGQLAPDQITWRTGDLDGDGRPETVLALPVTAHDNQPIDARDSKGATLFVIYTQDGHYKVDVGEPTQDQDHILMGPTLHTVADVAGLGHPQFIWSRPELIASGPQPSWVYVTTWKPGHFTNLPGAMAISRMNLALEGKDLLLTGMSRHEDYVRLVIDSTRTDRYRFVDGAFRLIDRRFKAPSEFGYDRFWDGLVAEASGRLADAQAAYQAAADPKRTAHSGSYFRYNTFPYELTPAELEAFAPALRTFARFRLGALLLQQKQPVEARRVLAADSGPFAGLTAAVQASTAKATSTRVDACQAATKWAAANPGFLVALNRGVGHSPWTPEMLCTHVPLDEPPLL